MIYELPQPLFTVAQPLYAEMHYDEAFTDAVFEGRQPGRIFVDDPQRPTAALMCRTFEYYVAGDPGCMEMRRFISDAPEEVGVFQHLYGYVGSNREWEDALLKDHDGRLHPIERQGFKHEGTLDRVRDMEASLSSEYSLHPIDGPLARRIDREMGQLIASFWGGYEEYAQGGFGFCAMRGDEIASVEYTIAVSSRYANIDVETAPGHRRKGLSAAASSAFIRLCMERGITTTWDCDWENTASYALAQKLGFTEYPPFLQLSPPRGTRLQLSSGLWEKAGEGGVQQGVKAWWRVGED